MAVTTINIDSQVLTFADLASFPVTGTVKTIYIAEDTNYQYYWDGSQYVLLTTEIDIPANLTFYATTAASGIAGYEKLVISIDDPDYDNPAVDVSTGAITGTGQLIAELASDAGIFAGNPGVITISTIGEIRRTAGSGGAEFYFEVYQRDSGGTETLVGTSNKTSTITTNVYQQFQTSALFNNGTWLTTDRVVIKYYADKVGGGSDPTYDFSFGGTNPVRTLFPISAQLLLNVPIAIGITGVTGGVTNEVLLTDGSGKLGQSELKTVNSNSLLGSGDVSVGTVTSIATAGLLSGGTITSSGTITTSINTNRLVGRSTAGVGVMEEITIGSGLTLSGGTLTAAGGGITIGSTAIASGTVNRILFEGAGNVVQQDSAFVWNNTDKRLILGTEAVANTNSRLVVIGKGTSTNTTFAVHNSTGTNNSFIIKDDGKICIGTNNPSNTAITIGDLIYSRTLINNTGGGVLYSRQDGNHSINVRLENYATTGANTSALFGGRAGDMQIAMGCTNESYTGSGTNQYLGGEVRSGVIIAKASSNNVAKLKFTVTNSTNAAINRFEWVSGTAISGTFSNGTTATPIMTLIGNGNLLLGTTSENAGSTKVLVINNGTAPSGNVTNSFQQYSADIVAGNAAPHFRTENGSIIKLYQETTGIAAAAFVANTSLIFDDSATYGGYTMGQVVAALKAQGLLA